MDISNLLFQDYKIISAKNRREIEIWRKIIIKPNECILLHKNCFQYIKLLKGIDLLQIDDYSVNHGKLVCEIIDKDKFAQIMANIGSQLNLFVDSSVIEVIDIMYQDFNYKELFQKHGYVKFEICQTTQHTGPILRFDKNPIFQWGDAT